MHLNININKSKKSIKEKDSTILQIIYDEILTNKKRMNIITLLINLLSFYLYYLSLEGCIGTQIDCLKIMTIDKFFELFYLVIFSSFLLSITLIFSFFNKISIFCMIYPIIAYILFYIIDHGSDLSYHGLYNFITFCISLFLFFFLLLIIVYLFILYHKKKKKIFFGIVFTFIIAIILIMTYLYSKTSCLEWDMGLNNIKLDNNISKYSCKYIAPTKCYMNAFDGFFDLSKFMRKNCKEMDWGLDRKEKLYNYLNESFINVTKIGFPITTNKDFWLRTQKNIEHFSERVLSRVVDMDNIKENITKPEVYIDFSSKESQNWKININLIKNETLIKERNDISKKINSSFDNILFIYLDSISRQHFKRKMPYLSKFIKKYLSKKNNSKSYQFLKYHNFAAFTQKNVQPMFYGEKMDPKSSNGTSIIKYFKQRGYITGQSSNLCSKELFVTMNNCLNKVEFSDFDHENVAMFCDPNYYDRKNPYPAFSGPFSVLRRCLYKKDSYEYVLEYGKQFWNTYNESKKFLRLSFIDAHESTGEVVKYLDKPIYDFLKLLMKKNLMKNTAIIFASDHGNGMPGIYTLLNSDDYSYENVLGFLAFVFLDFTLDENIKNNLEKNQQILVTPYDIHDTLIDIIYAGENWELNSRFGKSLFRDINGMERNCNKYEELMGKDNCRCINY